MPRLFQTGMAVMGNAGFTTSVDGAVPTPLVGSFGGGWAPLSDNEIIGQATIPSQGAAWRVYSVNLDTDVITVINPPAGFPSGFVSAGGGIWISFLSAYGVKTNIPGAETLGAFGPGWVDFDGVAAINSSYGTGAGILVLSPAGDTLQEIPASLDGYGAYWIRCRNGLLSYPTASGFPLVTAATGAPVAGYAQQVGVTKLIPMQSGTTAIVVEYHGADSTWSIRRADKATGLILNTSGTPSFGMDAIVLNGLVRLAWSTGEGESADELVLLDVNTSTGTTTRGTVVGGMIVWADGPTLDGTTFDMTGAEGTYPPYQAEIQDPKTGKVTRPWQQYFSTLGDGLQTVQTEVRKRTPPSVSPIAGAPFLLSDVPPEVLPQGRQVVDSPTVIWDFSIPGVASATVRAGGGSGSGVPGDDGEDGETVVIPGPVGAAGAAGASGVSISGPPGEDGDDGEDGLSIVGPTGAQGVAGAAGASITGPPGDDGSDGETLLLQVSRSPSGDGNDILALAFAVAF